MYNVNFTNNLENKKNEILNHIKSYSPDFYFNFLNQNKSVSKHQVPSRNEAFGAHMKFSTFTHDAATGWKNFSNNTEKTYYVTFNTIEMNNSLAQFSDTASEI